MKLEMQLAIARSLISELRLSLKDKEKEVKRLNIELNKARNEQNSGLFKIENLKLYKHISTLSSELYILKTKTMGKLDIIKNMGKHLDKEVLIVGSHDKKGLKGRTVDINEDSLEMGILLENGEKIFIKDPSLLLFITHKFKTN